jgi:hypothetical protein
MRGHIGRLDLMTEGLILVTEDGALPAASWQLRKRSVLCTSKKDFSFLASGYWSLGAIRQIQHPSPAFFFFNFFKYTSGTGC